ncbi:MAG TPA: hypothetical protein VIC62_05420 [Nakamurella sp.]|jgi:hypothetical protein
MGRHAKGAFRTRLTTTVGVAVPLAVIVAAGSWWAVDSSTQSAATVTGAAVVVSSLACQNGDEGTVVDLLDPVGQPPGTTRRATLDSCGHREGEVLAVDYSTDDPGRVVPAATDPDPDTGRQLMPLGVVLAALLGVAAAVAVIRDGHRVRSSAVPADGFASHGRHARLDEDEPPPVVDESPPVVADRRSEIDLLFPAHDRLAVSLHDELFTHRSPAGV